MLSKAKLGYLRISPRKVRLVADLIRGLSVEEARVVLDYTRKRAAVPILKLLNQAIANAKNKYLNVEDEDLFVSKILVNEGPTYKRMFPRARGRADVIQKRTSHVVLELDSSTGEVEERPEEQRKKTKETDEKKEGKKKERLEERKEQTGRKVRRGPKKGKGRLGKGKTKIFRRKAF